MVEGLVRERTVSADLVVCILLAVGVIIHLVAVWPWDLNMSDESQYLYEAKRLVVGEVLYRDIFEIVTPVAFWGIAILFRAFGATMLTARAAIAVVHALTAAFVYLTCRTLWVGGGISFAAATAYVVICHAGFSLATPHWISTCLLVLLLLLILRDHRAAASPSAFLPGVIVGTQVMVQQQRGVVA